MANQLKKNKTPKRSDFAIEDEINEEELEAETVETEEENTSELDFEPNYGSLGSSSDGDDEWN